MQGDEPFHFKKDFTFLDVANFMLSNFAYIEILTECLCISLCLSILPQPLPPDQHRCFVIMSLSIAVISLTTSLALTHLQHREKLEKNGVGMLYRICSDSTGEKHDRNLWVKIFTHGWHTGYITDMSTCDI